MTRFLKPLSITSVSLACLLGTPPLWAQATLKPLLDGPTTPVAYGANDVATGDLNGDGHLDLVSVNTGSSSISVRFGTGYGRFEGGADYAMDAGPRDLVLIDLDGDGVLDAVTANSTANTISVRLGDGAGGFGPMTLTPTGSEPGELALGDVDGDGLLDVIVAESGADTVSIFQGDGAGHFALSTTWAVGQRPTDVLLVDVDVDGDLDAVSVDQFSSRLSVALNDGAGGFAAPIVSATSYGPTAAAALDLTGDGIPDLALAVPSSGGLYLMQGTGSGQFIAATSVVTYGYPWEIEVADMDGDGQLDLVAAGSGTGSSSQSYVHVAFRLPGGGFGDLHSMAVGAGAYGLSVADVDHDSLPDVLSASYSTGISLVLNLGARQFAGAQNGLTLHNPRAVALGDLTGDGRDDVVVASAGENVYEYGGISVFVNNGAGVIGAGKHTKLPNGTREVAIAELTGDAHNDVLYAAFGYGFTILPGDGAGNLGAKVTVPTTSAPWYLDLADINHDGATDLAAASLSPDVITVCLSDGAGGYMPEVATVLPSSPSDFALGDVTGDGRLDAIVGTYAPSAVLIYPGNGDGSFQAPLSHALSGAASALAVGDLNADGVQDVVVIDNLGQTATVFVADGVGDVQAPFVLALDATPRDVKVVDFDGDGYADIAITDYSGSRALVLVNDGALGFAQQQSFAARQWTYGMGIGDLDGDGHPDMAVTNNYTLARSVTVLRSRSDATLWTDVGYGLAGVNGQPKLKGAGLLLGGQTSKVQLACGAPFTTAYLVIGNQAVYTPGLGGVLVPALQMLWPLPTSAGGLASLALTWPANVPSGYTLWGQVWMPDATSPMGVSASNGLQIQSP